MEDIKIKAVLRKKEYVSAEEDRRMLNCIFAGICRQLGYDPDSIFFKKIDTDQEYGYDLTISFYDPKANGYDLTVLFCNENLNET